MRPMAGDFEQRLKDALAARVPARPAVPGARAAAVLVPLVGEGGPGLILTRRTETLPSHRGQISFPGGSLDAGETAEAAALREAQEEIGLDPSFVRVLGELDGTPTFVSGYVITPVVGWLDRRPALRPNPAEVAAIIEVPIASLTEEIRVEPGFVHDRRSYPTEAWIYGENVIWGVTARLLRMFLHTLAGAGLAPAPGPTASPWPAEPAGPGP
jgi:8-oxo-dGTP pyrophosphatase MutT (NUDIX family)